MLSNTSMARHIKGDDLLTCTVQNSSIGGTPTGCYLGLEQVRVWCDTQKKMKVILNIFSNNQFPVLIKYVVVILLHKSQ